MSDVRSASVTDTGRRRRHNEDAFVNDPPLFAVADGMGGAQAGEVASRAAIDAIEHGLPDGPAPLHVGDRIRIGDSEFSLAT